jgi:hypothetical protein
MHCTIISGELLLVVCSGCWKMSHLTISNRSDMEYRVMPGLGLYLLRVKLVFMAKKVKLH